MADLQGIAAFLQRRLDESGLDEVTAVEAAVWLDDAGVLKDSRTRPGLPLRELLRAGKIPHAEQRPRFSNGRWYIMREGSRSAGPWSRSSAGTAHRDEDVAVSTRSGSQARRPLAASGEERGMSGEPVTHDDGRRPVKWWK